MSDENCIYKLHKLSPNSFFFSKLMSIDVNLKVYGYFKNVVLMLRLYVNGKGFLICF